MGVAAPLASTTETKNRTPRQGSSHGAKRYSLAPPYGCTLARSTLSVWSLANGCHTLLPLETSRCLGERPSGAPACGSQGACRWVPLVQLLPMKAVRYHGPGQPFRLEEVNRHEP